MGTGDNPASLLESLTDVISLGFFQRDDYLLDNLQEIFFAHQSLSPPLIL